MIIEDAYIEFITKHRLTQGQVLMLYLMYKKRVDLIKKYKETFPTDDGTMIGQYYIDDLVRKGLLVVKNNKYELGKEFYLLFVDKHSATDEIFDIYPTFFEKDGINVPLVAMDRNIFANIYDDLIKSSKLEHLEIIKDINFAISKNLLNIGIEKFLKSQYWKTIRPIRLENKLEEAIYLKADDNF